MRMFLIGLVVAGATMIESQAAVIRNNGDSWQREISPVAHSMAI